jgi:hypothetical protein
MSPMQAINRVTDPEARDVLLRLAAEHAQFKGRLVATAGVPCVKDDSWKRHPMKCFPKDPCSFCRARYALRGIDETIVHSETLEEERERVARIVEKWSPYAGVFSRHDLAAFIRRGDDL